MKNNYNLDDLDDFLSESAEQHRMYPSDKVWRNIDQELHGSKRWPALTFCAVLTVAIITAGLILIHPDKNLFTVNLPDTSGRGIVSANNAASKSLLPAISSTEKNSLNGGRSNSRPATNSSHDAMASIVSESLKNNAFPGTAPGFTNSFDDNDDDGKTGLQNSISPSDVLASSSSKTEEVQDHGQANVGNDENSERRLVYPSLNSNVFLEANNASGLNVTTKKGSILQSSNTDPNITASDILLSETIKQSATVSSSATKPFNKPAKWSALFYATPSISYRYLSEAKINDLHQQNGPVAPNFTHGVNNFVRHKPTAGFEVGATFIHNLTSSVRLRVGLQANIRGYSIEAYASQRAPSTIVLNRGFYTDSLITISSISNQQGYRPIEITNRYFEISVPVALDMRMANWKKIQVYVAAGLQPTYQFSQSMYMVSSDYKNYIQEPDLVRHFNLNTSFETFMTYKAAGVTWQVGPQIRYQLLPGATNQYPVHERLIDYGFKVGVVKTLR